MGEEKFQEVQKATRIAKITTVKSMIDEQLDEKIVNNDILKIQMLLKESPDDVKAKITEWAQKMNVDELMKVGSDPTGNHPCLLAAYPYP